MTVRIDAIAEHHIDGFRESVDRVARERKYLASTEGFSREATAEFVRSILAGDGVAFVAVDDERVVGWCDITRTRYEGQQHCGRLGMGLLPPYRGRGLGRSLLDATLGAAADIGLSRVELEVFASNTAARRLYDKLGFVEEGVKRRARIIDGVVDDIVCMAIFVPAARP